MECWYYDAKDLENTPSRKDGIDKDTEDRYRKEGAKFINEVGQALNLRYVTIASGDVYFHRFYMLHSFKEFNRFVIATACLFLAGKVEETPKKARDLLKAIPSSTYVKEEQIPELFGDDPKEELMTMERILLKTIKFDLQVDHPYKYMLRYAKTLKGDKAVIEKVAQMGWTFINDSLCTTLCLQWEPEIITIALMHLSCRLQKFEVSDWLNKAPGYKGKWWDQFVEDVSIELLESICHQVLDFYTNQQSEAKASPTAITKRTAPAEATVAPAAKQPRAEPAPVHNPPAPPQHYPPPTSHYPPTASFPQNGAAPPYAPVPAGYQPHQYHYPPGYYAPPPAGAPPPGQYYHPTAAPPTTTYPGYHQPPPQRPRQSFITQVKTLDK